MKSLVLLTTSFPRAEPGSEAAGSFVVDLCEALSELCRVTVVAPGSDNTVEKHGQFNIYRYRALEKPLSEMRVVHPFDVVNIFGILRSGANATRRATKEVNPDALIALWALPSGFWARNVAKKLRIPLVVWCLGSDIWSLGRIPIVKTVLKMVLSAADHVYADGYQLAHDVAALRDKGCKFLPSARIVDLNGPSPVRSTAPFRLVYVGRWHPNKGTDILLEALSMLDSDEWQLIERIDIYGGGILHDVVEDEVNRLCSMGRPMFLHGYIDKNRAIAAIQNSDWVLIPSRIESIPVIFSDAMQCHRPIVCTPVGDLPKLCKHNRVGFCVDEVSPSALASGIRQALHANPKRFENGLSSYAETFNLRSVARDLVNLFETNTQS